MRHWANKHPFNLSQLPIGSIWTPSCRGALKAFRSHYQPQPSQVPIYTPGWREAIIVKYLAQGHKCNDQDSNPHSGISPPELEFDALNHSAAILYIHLNSELLLPQTISDSTSNLNFKFNFKTQFQIQPQIPPISTCILSIFVTFSFCKVHLPVKFCAL